MANNEQNNKKINPDVLKWVIIAIIGFVVIVLIFGAGIFVGGMKARFSYRWAESYHKNFAGPREGFFGRQGGSLKIPFTPGDFIESRGTFGEVIKVNDSDIVIKGKDNAEKVILIGKDTIIATTKEEKLKVGDCAVVIGSPTEEGQIQAKLIRVFECEKAKDVGYGGPPPFFR